ERHRPEDQRHDPEDALRGHRDRVRIARVEDRLDGVQRARADVPEDNPEGADRERPLAGRAPVQGDWGSLTEPGLTAGAEGGGTTGPMSPPPPPSTSPITLPSSPAPPP